MTENRSNAKHFTRGGQVTFHNIRMFVQIYKVLFQILGCLFFAGIFGYIYFFSDGYRLLAGCYHYAAQFLYWICGYSFQFKWAYPFHGRWISETQYNLLNQPFFYLSANYLFDQVFKAVSIAISYTIVLLCLSVRWFRKKGEKQNSRKFIRGMELAEPKELKKLIIKNKKDSDLKVDNLPLLKKSELQHILLHGTTGAGKTQLIRKLLRQLRKRGERVIVYDKGCTLISEFLQEGDVILNPFDARCAPWDLWEEAPTAAHLENMAESLIPLHGSVDPFWVDAARTIFVSTAHKMRGDADRSVEKLVKLLLTMELNELGKYVKGTESATLTSDKIEKTAISIRSILTTYLKSMRFLFGVKTETTSSFSVRNWILNENNKGWLFISSNGENHKALKPLISMWIAMGSMTILSLSENEDRRIHFYIDEVTSLHKLPSLPETLAESRKHGGCFALGMQSFALSKAVYGYDSASGMWDLLNTRFFFRSPSSIMAKFAAEELGEIETNDPQENYSYGANSIRDGISMSHQRVVRQIVAYSEIMQLEDLQCYLRLPGKYPVTKLSLKYQKDPKIALGFTERKIPEMSVVEEAIILAPKIPELEAAPTEEEMEAEAEKTLEEERSKEAEKNKIRRSIHVPEVEI